MKKAAKVFLIIAIVLGGLNLFIGFVSLLGIGTWAGTEGSSELITVNMIGDSISLIYAAATIVISSLSLVKLNKATSKKELLVWGILCLFFGGFIPGILLLCIKDKDLVPEGSNSVSLNENGENPSIDKPDTEYNFDPQTGQRIKKD